MAIGTAAAILGSAVIGAGASAAISSSAAKKAANASNYAADQNAQVNREIYNQTRSDLEPARQVLAPTLGALMQRLGLSPMTSPGQPATQAQAAGNPSKIQGGFAGTSPLEAAPQVGAAPAPQGGGVNYAQLFQDRPDVRAEYDRVNAVADRNSPQYQKLGLDRGAEGFADYWLQNKPAEDTYAAPQLGAPQAPQQADPNAPPPQYYQETFAPRPEEVQVPQFGEAPRFSMNYGDIANDAGFQFETGETTKGVNAGSAARGLLRSGDAAKALQDRLFGVAHKYGQDYFNRGLATHDRNYQGFIDDRSYGTNLALQNRNRQDNIFSEDRGFQAGRNDQQTSNLFGLAGIGQNAAAGTANAGNVFAQNQINSNNQRASTTANAAIANAGNMTNLFGSAANAVGTYYGMQGGSGPRQYSI